jgi:cytoskeletal protein RodZ
MKDKKLFNSSKEFFVVLILSLIFFVGFFAGALGMIMVFQDYVPTVTLTDLPTKVTNTATSNAAKTSTSTNTSTNTTTTPSAFVVTGITLPTVSTTGWKTYTNSKNGYTAKYPTGWTVKNITDAGSGDMPCDQATFTSPEGHVVMFGLKKAGAQTNLSCRTGVGAYTAKFVTNVTILSTVVKMQEYLAQDDLIKPLHGVDEVILNTKDTVGYVTTTDKTHEFYADVAPKDRLDPDANSTKELLATAKAIFESVKYK